MEFRGSEVASNCEIQKSWPQIAKKESPWPEKIIWTMLYFTRSNIYHCWESPAVHHCHPPLQYFTSKSKSGQNPDATFHVLFFQGKTTGQDLLDNIYKYLNLIETAYFGLRYQDNANQTVDFSILQNCVHTSPIILFACMWSTWFSISNQEFLTIV